ncbi:hypothetical protein [Zoogloea sp. LCSB751]|uniref:hypothetical protein n=1 Tax=Zoogloea sp. LCSB751 TaxID=1965277 RepID=UPI0009A4E2D8|nr:hypothetical protein [Zoogloea sp. LCSB751]
MRVQVRSVAVKMVGQWFLEQLQEQPSLRGELPADQVEFLCSMAVRSGGYVEKGRPFFERFVVRWGGAIAIWNPGLCFQIRPALGVPPTPEAALAEIVEDIRTALQRKPGRQVKVYPVLAYEANERAKKSRKRNAAGISSAFSREAASDEIGVSLGAMPKAVKRGREIAEVVQGMKALFPPGTEFPFALVNDRGEGPPDIVLAAQVRERKSLG